MQIIEKKLSELHPYENNPRKNDEAVQFVANSIQEFGFRTPIIIDRNNTIVCGHTRYKAAKKLKMTKVPCIMADDLTDEQIKMFRLADNRVAEFSEWNLDRLDVEMNELERMDIDMTLFGFGYDNNYSDENDEESESSSETDMPSGKIYRSPKCGYRFSAE